MLLAGARIGPKVFVFCRKNWLLAIYIHVVNPCSERLTEPGKTGRFYGSGYKICLVTGIANSNLTVLVVVCV